MDIEELTTEEAKHWEAQLKKIGCLITGDEALFYRPIENDVCVIVDGVAMNIGRQWGFPVSAEIKEQLQDKKRRKALEYEILGYGVGGKNAALDLEKELFVLALEAAEERYGSDFIDDYLSPNIYAAIMDFKK